MNVRHLSRRRRGRIFHFALIALTAAVSGFIAPQVSRAMEPRPWLCRQIPVFSADKAMSWQAQQSGGGHWVMTFMHYDPAGGHDGFTVVSSREVVGGEATGELEAGQYYAVALHRLGSHWICPANASETEATGGALRSLCYGEDEDGCDVKLTVRSAP